MGIKVKSIEEGVEKIFNIRKQFVPSYKIKARQAEEYVDTLIWKDKRIPLMDDCFDFRIRAIAKYGSEATENCALNVYSFVGNDISLSRTIYREMVIAEFILHSSIKKVTAYKNGNAANIIAVMENGTCANIDIGNTMMPGSVNQCQHRLITKKGMANDRGVSDITVQHQVYVYAIDSEKPQIYDDDEHYLYGLEEEEIRKVLAIRAVLLGQEDCDAWISRAERCRKAVEAVYTSDKYRKSIYLDEL